MSWTVDKVMTREVVAVRPTTGYRELVRLMTEHRVSALPVVDVVDADGRLVGIVSEADLLPKEERTDRARRPQPRSRGDEAKARGLTAAEVMTSAVLTVRPEDTLARAARALHRRGVKRLPVVDGRGRLVGIVSRSDLLKPFLRSDESIRREVVEDVAVGTLGLGRDLVQVTVEDGVVTLEGELETRTVAERLAGLARSVEGVVGVKDRLTHRMDDASPRRPPAHRVAGPPPE